MGLNFLSNDSDKLKYLKMRIEKKNAKHVKIKKILPIAFQIPIRGKNNETIGSGNVKQLRWYCSNSRKFTVLAYSVLFEKL